MSYFDKSTMNEFVNLARNGKNSLGYYVASFVLIMLAWSLGSLPGGWALANRDTDDYFIPTYWVTGLMLASFGVGLLALWLVVKHIHQRSPFTLISGSAVRWRRILASAGWWLGLTILVELATYFIMPNYYRLSFKPADWWPALAIGLVLIPIQTSFEELFIRGYLMQAVGSWHLWIGVVASTLFFGFLHGANDEVAAVGLGMAMIYYMGVGLFFALLTVFDKTLELPLGIHAANNIYAFLLVGYPSNSLPSATIWETTTLNFPLMMAQWVVVMVLYTLAARQFLGFGKMPYLLPTNLSKNS
ncbi:MAG: CPBP family intramembrane metalloprotease [Cytophagia bacterium]|nr:MAG: CPBP family intramembrane metalloprotease [Runella sp.]TAG17660.1 MAG: CPBP family intramembrane metalloprotease [Cytophagales bacterium]TAG40045.1 MAG: CPBP family intramembrane metalloprotease [Cytophagia bacterium]TAG67852.1 MAG: CPBP family intramembrane metalloprotease [Runella slithyformis]TAG78232.1 MAG: CPBP family intramembrane metalloprotease [Cytophagales bacterium]